METKLTIKSIEENKIVYNAISAYCNINCYDEGREVGKTITKDFIIKKENDNWLISYFYLPN